MEAKCIQSLNSKKICLHFSQLQKGKCVFISTTALLYSDFPAGGERTTVEDLWPVSHAAWCPDPTSGDFWCISR